MWEFIEQFWDQGVDVVTLIIAVLGAFGSIGLLRRRSKTIKDLLYVEQERDDFRKRLAISEVKLSKCDPERFIENVNELYASGAFDKAEEESLAFTNK